MVVLKLASGGAGGAGDDADSDNNDEPYPRTLVWSLWPSWCDLSEQNCSSQEARKGEDVE